MKNIQNLIFYKKKLLLIFVIRPPDILPLKPVISSHKWFFTDFSENTAFFEKLV